MKLSLSQAAKEAGKSKSTISEAIKNKELSATKKGNRFEIDPAELFRVFPKGGTDRTEPETEAEHPSNGAKDTEIRMLRELLDAKDNHISDLKDQLEKAHAEKQVLLAAPAQNDKRTGIFSWFRK